MFALCLCKSIIKRLRTAAVFGTAATVSECSSAHLVPIGEGSTSCNNHTFKIVIRKVIIKRKLHEVQRQNGSTLSK